MGKTTGFIVVLLIGSFSLPSVSYGQEKVKSNLSVSAKRVIVLDRRKLLQSPTRHPIFWNKPGHWGFPLYTGRGGCSLPPKAWECPKWRWYKGRLYRSSSFDEHLLSPVNADKKCRRRMGVGEQIAEAYFGGVVGGLLGTYITWQVIQIQYGETEEDWGGVRAYLALLGGTVGVSVGSAVWLNIQRGGNRRRLGWAFLGAAIPTALMTAMELTFHPTKGHFPYVLMLSWGLAPIGAVIGHNLAD